MSWLTIIAIAYAGLVIALYLVFAGKPFYFNYKGDRKRIHAPLGKLLIIAGLAAFALVSLPIHIVCRFVGLRGFWDWREKSYTTQNPFRRAGRR